MNVRLTARTAAGERVTSSAGDVSFPVLSSSQLSAVVEGVAVPLGPATISRRKLLAFIASGVTAVTLGVLRRMPTAGADSYLCGFGSYYNTIWYDGCHGYVQYSAPNSPCTPNGWFLAWWLCYTGSTSDGRGYFHRNDYQCDLGSGAYTEIFDQVSSCSTLNAWTWYYVPDWRWHKCSDGYYWNWSWSYGMQSLCRTYYSSAYGTPGYDPNNPSGGYIAG